MCAAELSEMAWSNYKFASHFGVAKSTAVLLLAILQWSRTVPFLQCHVLWALYFLCNYDTLDVMAEHFHMSPTMFTEWIWQVLHALAGPLHTVSSVLFAHVLTVQL